jgi:putative SOS response-associated peptidase YedK
MCYDIKASLETQLLRAKRLGDAEAIAQIEEELLPQTELPLFHASGFSHPKMFIYTDVTPDYPTVATWGLVPFWVKSEEQHKKLWNQTLNARSETLFEKPAFRDSARHRRCLLYVDGFYEHHHFNANTYPFYISRKDGKPLIFGCLYSDWKDPELETYLTTFTIVTTTGNPMMGKIHNNPKLNGPRMPLVLDESKAEDWLQPNSPLLQEALENLMHPLSDELLQAFTVSRLRGKSYLGNVPEVCKPVSYPELSSV